VLRPPKPGRTGESGGAVSRTDLKQIRQDSEAKAGNSSEGKAVARCRLQSEGTAGGLRGVNPQLSKGAAGSREESAGDSDCKLWTVHAGAERAELQITWNFG